MSELLEENEGEYDEGRDSDVPDVVENVLDPLVPDAVDRAAFVPGPPGGRPLPRRWWGRHVRELRWQLELAELPFDPVFYGIGVPRGDGTPVLLIPGFLAGDPSLTVMARWLRRLGYRPRRAHIVGNVDCSDRAVDRLERRLERTAERYDRPVALIGHSRGGHFAKALGRRRPDLVAGVVSLGAGLDRPFDISVPTKAAVTAVRGVLVATSSKARRSGCLTDTCLCRYAADYGAPFPREVPLTSVYTRKDGVVWWRACVVPYADNVEVPASHIGLAFNRHAYRAIAHALAGTHAAAGRST